MTRIAGTASLALTLLALAAPPAGASPLAGPPLAVGRYTTITVPGAAIVQAEGISDSGTIVGCDQRKAGGRGFVEKGGKFTVLADPKAGPKGNTCAAAINSKGVIVGRYGSPQFHGFVFNGTTFTTINDPRAGHGPGEGTAAVGINDSGVIVGWYITAKHSESGFVLRNGKFTSVRIPAPIGAKKPGTVLNGISDNGTMTGFYFDQSGGDFSFTLHGANLRGISVPHAQNTIVACISEHGKVIVGTYQVTDKAPTQAFILRNGVYRTLRAAAGQKTTVPQCGNDHGDVAGYVQSDRASGFLFTPGK